MTTRSTAMPRIRFAAAGALCLLLVSLDSRMIREASAEATLIVRLPKTAAPATSISVVAVAAETGHVLASLTAASANSQVTLTVRAVPQMVFGEWLLSDGTTVSGHSPLLRPVEGRTLTVDFAPRSAAGMVPVMINAAYTLPGFFASTAQAGGGAIGIGVPAHGFTVKGLDVSGRAIARTVTTEMIDRADCYDEDGGFVVVETDPAALAILKAEIDLSNSPYGDPSTRMTNRYVAPSLSVSGSWSSDGTNVTVTLRVVDSQGGELLNQSATGPLSQLFDISARVASALAAAMCGSRVEVRLTYTGFLSLYGNGKNDTCPGVYRGGTDVVEGVVRTVGRGDALDGEVVYQGVLKRRTHLGICDAQERNGHEDEHDWCAMVLSGTKDVAVTISVGSQQGDGARVRMDPVPGSISVSTTGGCGALIQSEWRADYVETDDASFDTVPPGRLRAGRYRQYGEGASGGPGGEWILEVLRAAEGAKAVPGGRRDF